MDNQELVQLMSDMMDSKLEPIKKDLQELNKKVDSIDKKQDTIYDEVARTREDITGIKVNVDRLNNDMNFVESAAIKNINDIQNLKSLRP